MLASRPASVARRRARCSPLRRSRRCIVVSLLNEKRSVTWHARASLPSAAQCGQLRPFSCPVSSTCYTSGLVIRSARNFRNTLIHIRLVKGTLDTWQQSCSTAAECARTQHKEGAGWHLEEGNHGEELDGEAIGRLAHFQAFNKSRRCDFLQPPWSHDEPKLSIRQAHLCVYCLAVVLDLVACKVNCRLLTTLRTQLHDVQRSVVGLDIRSCCVLHPHACAP